MASTPRRAPELLAPAGGPDALRAAVTNGADAVYLGVDVLNARRSAENFTLDGLPEVCRFAHLRGVRIYLTVNVVVLPAEMVQALELVDEAWAAGVDAVIVQDLGLLWCIRTALPHVRVHSSTQLNTHNLSTTEALAHIGVSRVTLAREVSLREIEELVSGSSIEIESFVHGALCVCYSGQCLMSSVIGRRSANRGQCAQPCRLAYELVDATGEVLGTPGAHLLSPKDLAGIAVLPTLVESEVAALKIEGRMKNPEYVALVTGVYRGALDRAAADPEGFAVRDGELAVLSEAFSRGFTESYLLGERGNDMMSYARPNNRGVFVGRVTDAAAGRVTVALESAVDAADTLEFWTSSGRFAQPAGPLEHDGARLSAGPAGMRVTLEAERPVAIGDRVFRVRNAALADAARRTFERTEEASMPLDFSASVLVGQPLRIEVKDADGRSGAAQGAVVEPARTKAVNAEEVIEHVGRLGGTPYRIGDFALELSPGAGVGFSSLHRVRRDAIGAYEAAVLTGWSTRERSHPVLPRTGHAAKRAATPDIVVEASSLDVALACLSVGAARAQVPTHELVAGKVPQGIVPLAPRILHDREVAAAMRFAEKGRPFVAANLGALHLAAKSGAEVEAHWSLNAMNAYATKQLVELGASLVWLSPELSGRQIAEVCAGAGVPVGIGVWGRQEVMVTEHCVLMAEGDCDRRCGSCTRRRVDRGLRDRKGYTFPVRTDVSGRSHLYNSVPLDLTGAMDEVLAAGVSALRLDVHTENTRTAEAAVREVISACRDALAGRDRQGSARSATTSGHFFRGVT
ncbi:MAG: U32 family peptidase [Coriobacteriia bacterium]|nr:U32 family peptidase [Coriobacteriia bacterium]